jgi:hypothetical protein
LIIVARISLDHEALREADEGAELRPNNIEFPGARRQLTAIFAGFVSESVSDELM